MKLKRTLTVTAAAAAVALAPGIANAVPGEPGQCSGTGYCAPTNLPTSDNGDLDGARVVWDGPDFWDYVRAFESGILNAF